MTNVKILSNSEKEYRKTIVSEMLKELTCIEVATNVFNLTVHKSSRSQRYLKPVEHSSMVFDILKNKVYWNARCGSVPLNVIEFYSEYTNTSTYDAINILLEYFYSRNPNEIEQYLYDFSMDESHISQGLVLTQKNDNNERAIHYLTNERKLSDSLVSKLIEDGIVYEDIYHNVVFVGYDVNNIKEKKPVFAIRRGTDNSKFHIDCEGSFKNNGLFYQNFEGIKKIVVTESVIDGLSYISLNRNNLTAHVLMCSGVGTMLNTLKYNLKNNPALKNLEEIEIMPDLDDAGVIASNKIKKWYDNEGVFNDNGNTVSLEIKTYGYDGKPNLKIKDLNDLLRVTVYYEENRILREQSELEDRESNDNMEM